MTSNRSWFLARRVLQAIPVVLGVTLLAFFMIHLVPGDPARTALGIHATPRTVALLRHQWGLDRPVPTQYLVFMERLAHADVGNSLFYQVPARTVILARLGPTIWLIVYATILSVLISFPLAAAAATKKESVRDHAIRAIPLLGLGMPTFWVGIMLILLLALKVRLFPVGGYGQGILGHAHSMFLPALTVALALTPILIRSLRASLIAVLESDYVTTARSKGIREWRVLTRHALRNAVVSTVTVLGINIAYLVGGTLVAERVFGIPGIGALMVDAIFNRDFPIVEGVALIFAVLVVLVNLITDLLYLLLDPRIRFD